MVPYQNLDKEEKNGTKALSPSIWRDPSLVIVSGSVSQYASSYNSWVGLAVEPCADLEAYLL